MYQRSRDFVWMAMSQILQVRNESHKINKFDKNQLNAVCCCHLFAGRARACRMHMHCDAYSKANSNGSHCFQRSTAKRAKKLQIDIQRWSYRGHRSHAHMDSLQSVLVDVRRTIDTNRYHRSNAIATVAKIKAMRVHRCQRQTNLANETNACGSGWARRALTTQRSQ